MAMSMRTALLAPLFCSGWLYAWDARADPIFVTGGSATVQSVLGGPFTLIGDNFNLTGVLNWGVGSRVGEPGQTLPIDVFNSGLDVRSGPGIFDGVSYLQIFYDGFLQFSGNFLVPDEPGQLTLTTPFLFTSSLQGCSTSTFAAGCPPGDFIFAMDLIGEGTATISLSSFPTPRGQLFQVGNVTYDFAPIPEPGASVLLGTGLASLAAAARRKRRRVTSQPSTSAAFRSHG